MTQLLRKEQKQRAQHVSSPDAEASECLKDSRCLPPRTFCLMSKLNEITNSIFQTALNTSQFQELYMCLYETLTILVSNKVPNLHTSITITKKED